MSSFGTDNLAGLGDTRSVDQLRSVGRSSHGKSVPWDVHRFSANSACTGSVQSRPLFPGLPIFGMTMIRLRFWKVDILKSLFAVGFSAPVTRRSASQCPSPFVFLLLQPIMVASSGSRAHIVAIARTATLFLVSSQRRRQSLSITMGAAIPCP